MFKVYFSFVLTLGDNGDAMLVYGDEGGTRGNNVRLIAV